MTGTWGVAAAIIGSVLGAVALLGAGLFAARATKVAAKTTAEAQQAAAEAAAAPAAQQANLAVLEATVRRVDAENASLRTENREIRDRQTRMERILKAFSWTLEDFYRWARNPVGDPPPPHPLVDEYNRTGV